jgi:hypothetical protein
MTNPPTTTSTTSTPIVIQHESSFNTGIILNETNYDLWSQMLKMQIAEKEKLSFIRDDVTPPKDGDSGYEKWYADNQRVKRWLLMSMTPDIMKRYIRLPTAREIWKALSKAFYDGTDELRVFSLNQRAFSAKQIGRPLSIFYGELTEIFSELDHRDKVVMKDSSDVEAYRNSIQRQRVHIFLAGLDDDFEQIRGEILRKDPVPGLEECYAFVRREDLRRGAMNGQQTNSEASAMAAQNRSNRRFSQKNDQKGDKPKYTCDHCGLPGHSKSRCYELVGYPEGWDHTRDSRRTKSSRSTPIGAIAGTRSDGDGGSGPSAMAVVAGNGGKVLKVSAHVRIVHG